MTTTTTIGSAVIRREGRIATVRFDRGERMNAFGPGLVQDMIDVAASFRDDLETSVIVVTGTQDYFSAGADLKDTTYRDPDIPAIRKRHVMQGGVRLAAAWESLPQVTIAAISGLAIGAGGAFALACDWRVMDRDAYMLLPEVRLGMAMQWNTMPRLVALVGPAKTKRLLLLCEKVYAPELLDMGLIDRMAETKGGAPELAREWAETVAGFDPLTVRMVKEGVTAVSTALHKGLTYADADQVLLGAMLNAELRTLPGKG